MHKLARYASIALVIAACSKKSETQPAAQPARPAPAPTQAVAKSDELTKAADGKFGTGGEDRKFRDSRKVIRTGRLDLVIDDYDATRSKLDAVLQAAGGYIDSTQVEHSRGAV